MKRCTSTDIRLVTSPTVLSYLDATDIFRDLLKDFRTHSCLENADHHKIHLHHL